MEIIKIIGIALIALIIIIMLKQYRPEYAIFISILTGILILFLVMDRLSGIVNLIQSVQDKFSVNTQFIALLIKITGIAFLSEFAVSICKDSGEGAIASKIELGSKIIIVSTQGYTDNAKKKAHKHNIELCSLSKFSIDDILLNNIPILSTTMETTLLDVFFVVDANTNILHISDTRENLMRYQNLFISNPPEYDNIKLCEFGN